MKVVVVGGGLAGMAAALDLLDGGAAVELIEKRDQLGGSLASWTDADGDHLAGGLHWYSKGDTALLHILQRAGVADRIRWGAPGVAIARPGGATSHLSFPPLPPPLNLIVACAANDLLTPREKLMTIVGLASSAIGTGAYVASRDEISYARWHDEHRIPQRVREKLFEPVVRTLTWLTGEQVAARPLVALLHLLATTPEAAQLGTLDGPTTPRLIEPLAALLAAQGATIHTGTVACKLLLDRDGASGIALANGQEITGDAYLLATQPGVLLGLLPTNLLGLEPFRAAGRLDAVHTITVLLWLDRYVHYSEHLYLTADACFSAFGDLALASPIQYDRHNGSLVALSVVPAAPLWVLPDDEIVARCRTDLQRLWPGVRGARLLKSAVVRQPDALYRAAPGANRHRPDGRTPLHNLFLAGDWTASAGAASMEGAVRSGLRASRLALKMLDA